MAFNRHLERAETVFRITDIVIQSRAIHKKIEELGGFRDSSLLSVANDFWAIQRATSFEQAMVDYLYTEEAFRTAEMRIEWITNRAQALSELLDEIEDKFRRYNIPKLSDSETIVDYVGALDEFMGFWKDEVVRGRDKGIRSLIQRVQQLGQSETEQEEGKTTFEAIKAVVIELGVQISRHLIEYFLLMPKRDAIANKIDNVSVILQYLRVNDNSSIIKSFSSVVELVKNKMRDSGKCSMDLVANVSYVETEAEVHHLILGEVLRLDVALYSPHLPMMSVEDVYLSKGSLLRKEFENTLKKVSWKMNELKTELSSTGVGDEDPETWNHLKEEVKVGIEEIWNRLELK
ncbi:hypothetical protein TorRG33x02_192650 [Trema orientale]|uniref:Uncharacterized protein n=1 Tax=Trema orientale TaxID=63057 RepID=A0A2P5EHM2_TREOI|nr:hypothetical protein TorRG33x02_192650 [Trema orientale]